LHRAYFSDLLNRINPKKVFGAFTQWGNSSKIKGNPGEDKMKI